MKDRGFTLVEMMVALAIFAMVASAGVLLLRTSVDIGLEADCQISRQRSSKDYEFELKGRVGFYSTMNPA